MGIATNPCSYCTSRNRCCSSIGTIFCGRGIYLYLGNCSIFWISPINFLCQFIQLLIFLALITQKIFSIFEVLVILPFKPPSQTALLVLFPLCTFALVLYQCKNICLF